MLYENHSPALGETGVTAPAPEPMRLSTKGDGVCEGEMEMGTPPQELGTFLGFKRGRFDASLLPHSAPVSLRGAAALPRLRGLR